MIKYQNNCTDTNRSRLGDDLQIIFRIPWGHNKIILDKCKGNSAKARDDEQSGDSNSIINQKKMLEKYATEQGFTNLRHYTDDGRSGTNFDRPDWKRMLADIEDGIVGSDMFIL